MGRGLDGYFLPCSLVRFSSSTGVVVSPNFRWRIAKGKHLFPFRTEQLSLSAPMVLGGQPPGRVGRRRFLLRKPPLRRLSSFRALQASSASAYGRRRKGRSASRRRRLVRGVAVAVRRRVSQLGDVLPTGSRPYSPSVAKSIIRSTASVSRPAIFDLVSNMGSYSRGGFGRQWGLAMGLAYPVSMRSRHAAALLAEQ